MFACFDNHGKGADGPQKLDALSLPHCRDRPVLVVFKKSKVGPASIDLYSRSKAEKKLGYVFFFLRRSRCIVFPPP